MQLLCEDLEVIRKCANRNEPSNQFTVVMTLASVNFMQEDFTDDNSAKLALQIWQRLSDNANDEVKIVNAQSISPKVRTDEVPRINWLIDRLFPQVGLTTTSFIKNHGQGQHEIRSTVERLKTLETRRQWWMLVKWVAYTITGALVATWALVQLLEKLVQSSNG